MSGKVLWLPGTEEGTYRGGEYTSSQSLSSSNYQDFEKATTSVMDETDLKIKALTAEMNGQLGRFEERLNNAINNMAENSRDLKTDLKEINKSLESKIEGQKRTTWGAAGVTIATVLAGYALVFQAFDTGRETAALTEKSAQDVKNASELLTKVQAVLDEQLKKSKEQQTSPPIDKPESPK
jgi:hypothetical protein